MKDQIIHFLFFKCDKETLFMEKENSGILFFIQRFRMHIHFNFCKKCKSYNNKMIFLESLMIKKIGEYRNVFNNSDVQLFKNKVRGRIKEKNNLLVSEEALKPTIYRGTLIMG